jgi:ABC-type maltose transport system permease subunit
VIDGLLPNLLELPVLTHARLTILLAIAPILVVFLFSQRALVSGMLAGATKE